VSTITSPRTSHSAKSAITEADLAAAGGAEKRTYVRRMFSDIAPSYDKLNHLLSMNVDRWWRIKALKYLKIERNPGGTYLDLCAGTLDVSAQLAKVRGFRGHVIGADFAEPMLRAGLGKMPPKVLSPVTSDAMELPLADASIAGAIVAFGIRNVADLDAGLREVYRVLQPGGRFVILEFTTPSNPVFRTLYEFYFHNILPKVGGLISGHRSAYSYLPKSVANFPREPELAQRMQRANFTNVTWRSLTFGIAAIHVGEKH
jgi:demethylmenaquinone methyltransferase/2-methoxy-6-polyprenyl-1,4-benzoquinol methylase